MICKRLFLVTVSLAALSCAAKAEEQVLQLEKIVISPNRAPTEASKVGSKVETVTQEEIQTFSLTSVNDYLSLLPGVSVSSIGVGGQETSISIRGADKKYIKTLYNGIDIADTSAPQNQVSFENLLAGGVSRIEVLKGSQGTLYGADAVAGVISISTLTDIGLGTRHFIGAEAGSFGTARGSYKLTHGSETGNYALTIDGVHSDGISLAETFKQGAERDRFRNGTGTIAFEQDLSDSFSLFGSGFLIHSNNEFDASTTPPTDSSENHGKSRQLAGRLGANFDLADGRFKNTVSAQIFDLERSLLEVSEFGPFEGDFAARRHKFDYQGSFETTDWLTMQFGADHERQRARASDNYGTDTNEDMTLTGVWGQALVSPIENLNLGASVRHDEHSEFGGYTTWRLTGAYLLPDSATRFHSSVGTGFRAPSLYELYSPFSGNRNLKPEQSTSFDIGIEQQFMDGRLVGDITYFLLNTDDLIDYSYDTYSYVQSSGTTKRQGVEVSARYEATDRLDLGAAYTFTHTQQPDGERRPRIPAHNIALTAVARPAERWEISATAQAVLDVQDIVSGSNVGLDDYVLINAKVAYKPSDNTELYLRGQNLLDQKYEVIKGYGMPGASVFAGFKATF